MIKAALLPILVVGLLSCGQVGFKIIGDRLSSVSDILKSENALVLFIVMALYGAATVAWIYVLSYMTLSRAFTFYALTFVFVPVLSATIFNEKIGIWQVAGALLIIGGVILSTRS